MAAAAGRSLLLLLSSRGGGGGASGCGALTAGCFPGLGVSRHRQQQQHRTVSERARRLREGGAAPACGSRGRAGRRGSGRVTSTQDSARGCRAPRSRRALQAPAAATGKGGRAGGSQEEEEGRWRGCSRRTGDTRAGKGRHLNLSVTRLRSRSLPPFLRALPQGSRTDPVQVVPLSPLGGLGCPELPRLPCV